MTACSISSVGGPSAAPTWEAGIAPEAGIIENPVSGERIMIRSGQHDRNGTLVWDLFLAPGGRVPSSHVHPEQEERFTVLSGRLAMRTGVTTRTVGPGETVTVTPGTVHSFANRTVEPVHVLVQTQPALGMAALLETAAALAQEQAAAHRSLPRLVDLVLFMREFEREVRAPYLPKALVRLVIRLLSGLARAGGYDRHYLRLRVG
ncbi:MAG TPA: cupin domain-containing protein [Pseudonocardiaceae bacterium]|nr:cupin domain-containing protein [Pseudonocardiaceae bacterium]